MVVPLLLKPIIEMTFRRPAETALLGSRETVHARIAAVPQIDLYAVQDLFGL